MWWPSFHANKTTPEIWIDFYCYFLNIHNPRNPRYNELDQMKEEEKMATRPQLYLYLDFLLLILWHNHRNPRYNELKIISIYIIYIYIYGDHLGISRPLQTSLVSNHIGYIIEASGIEGYIALKGKELKIVFSCIFFSPV